MIFLSLTILSSIVLYGLLGLNLINPFAWDAFKTRSFYCLNVDGRLFNAYFKPFGAYSGGEGDFWITESFKYFPIIETEKYYEHSILWDFRDSEFDGQPVNQEEMVKAYVRDKILEKEDRIDRLDRPAVKGLLGLDFWLKPTGP